MGPDTEHRGPTRAERAPGPDTEHRGPTQSAGARHSAEPRHKVPGRDTERRGLTQSAGARPRAPRPDTAPSPDTTCRGATQSAGARHRAPGPDKLPGFPSNKPTSPKIESLSSKHAKLFVRGAQCSSGVVPLQPMNSHRGPSALSRVRHPCATKKPTASPSSELRPSLELRAGRPAHTIQPNVFSFN